MPDVFITLEEAAAFEGITYEAMKKRVQRSPEQHNVKSQAREGGGKDQVLISTSSLSAKARKAWRAAQKVEGSEVIIDKRAQEAVPWYVTADLNQYTEANKKRFYEAVELAARVQDFIDYDGPDRTGYAERYALGLGISPQSLYRYMKNVLEANAWALKLEKEDGKSRDYFRALALCRKPKETGTFPSLTDEQKAIIERTSGSTSGSRRTSARSRCSMNGLSWRRSGGSGRSIPPSRRWPGTSSSSWDSGVRSLPGSSPPMGRGSGRTSG